MESNGFGIGQIVAEGSAWLNLRLEPCNDGESVGSSPDGRPGVPASSFPD